MALYRFSILPPLITAYEEVILSYYIIFSAKMLLPLDYRGEYRYTQ